MPARPAARPASEPAHPAPGGVGPRDRAAGDRGSVTVEAALALCALLVVLAMALAGVSLTVAQVRCTDAAREAVRLAARGEQARGVDLARRIAPDGAQVRVRVHGDEVTARVSVAPAGGLLPRMEVVAEAVALLEPLVVPDLGQAPGATQAPGTVPEPGLAPEPGVAPEPGTVPDAEPTGARAGSGAAR